MFNSLVFNPGYAGSKGHMSVNALHRSQWWEIDGAPTTQTLAAHTPLRNERVAVGMTVINDKIGPTNSTSANLIYAYRIPFGEKLKLSIGLQAGVESYKGDFKELNLEDPNDPAFNPFSKVFPNFGGGLFLYQDNFYIGASTPYLVEYDLRPDAVTDIYAKKVRHYYFTTGAAFKINGDALIFKPSILVKNVGLDKKLSKIAAFEQVGAPTEVDVDISFLFHQSLWLGASYRTSWNYVIEGNSSPDSGDVWLSYLLKNGFRFGVSYDYPLTELSNVTTGAFEIMLGYEFSFNEQKVVTPRYF